MAIPPSALKVLVNLPVAAEWRRLGGQLGVRESKLDEIQANNERSTNFVQDCLRDMFKHLLNKDDDTTYERLARGIRNIKKIGLVKEFLQQHSDGEEVYSKLAHALDSIGERNLAGEDGEIRVLLCIQCSIQSGSVCILNSLAGQSLTRKGRFWSNSHQAFVFILSSRATNEEGVNIKLGRILQRQDFCSALHMKRLAFKTTCQKRQPRASIRH